MIELTLDNIKQYLISKKLIERTEIISVDDVDNGGFINRIFIIKIANKKKQRSLVIKQFLDCATSCPINPRVERAKYEVEALKLIPKYLGDEAIIPKVIFADLKNNLFIMNEAPHKNGTYKQQILNHEFNLNIPYKIGRFHALLHSKTFKKKEVKERLQNNPGYYDLRFEASFKYPAEKNKRLLAKLKPFFEKMLSNKLCLIHADTTPKNILVQADIITIVDWEAATYGDPAHDVGITFAHYIMYACNNPEKAELCLLSGKIYYETYMALKEFHVPEDKFLENVQYNAAAMILGRIDGRLCFTFMKHAFPVMRKIVDEFLKKKFESHDKMLEYVHEVIEKNKKSKIRRKE